MQTSIVPEAGHVTYPLLDQIGSYSPIWREMSNREANEATIIDWSAKGQFDCPLRIVAFNTEEGWSRDVTKEIAAELLDMSGDGRLLGQAANEFVERVTDQTPIAVA
jgi:hypothetical protein